MSIRTSCSNQWLALLKEHGWPQYSAAPEMFDYALRMRNMDRARVDLASQPARHTGGE